MRIFLAVAGTLVLCTGSATAQTRDSTRTDSLRRTRLPAADSVPPVPHCAADGPVTPARAAADSVCLNRRDAVSWAVERNPQIQAGVELVAQARARRVQGVAIPDPQFAYTVGAATGLFGGSAKDKVLETSLTIPFLDKFRLRGRIGRADIQATEAGLTSLRQIIAAQTSQTYDSVLVALARQRILLQVKALAADFVAKTEARFRAGSTPRLDVVKAQVERDADNARASLNRLLNRSLGSPVGLADTLAVPPELPPLADLEAMALRARPEITGLERQQQGAKAVTALAREYWLPDIIFGLGKNYADPGPGIITTGVAFPLPVFFWQHSKGEIAEARHRELELAANAQDLRSQIAQDVRVSYATAATALRQVVFIRDQLLPAAREAYRIASVSYGLGGSSALEVLDARRALRDAENQYADALAAANIARADLGRAIATSLDGAGSGGSHGR